MFFVGVSDINKEHLLTKWFLQKEIKKIVPDQSVSRARPCFWRRKRWTAIGSGGERGNGFDSTLGVSSRC